MNIIRSILTLSAILSTSVSLMAQTQITAPGTHKFQGALDIPMPAGVPGAIITPPKVDSSGSPKVSTNQRPSHASVFTVKKPAAGATRVNRRPESPEAIAMRKADFYTLPFRQYDIEIADLFTDEISGNDFFISHYGKNASISVMVFDDTYAANTPQSYKDVLDKTLGHPFKVDDISADNAGNPALALRGSVDATGQMYYARLLSDASGSLFVVQLLYDRALEKALNDHVIPQLEASLQVD